ncbi:MAG: hypothetical protein K0R24_2040 [Gammaproteobacteria bacterium]|jgi:hypothetical protein|nr:hypothetical protein [Gammaproteobacteria bacterium]
MARYFVPVSIIDSIEQSNNKETNSYLKNQDDLDCALEYLQ